VIERRSFALELSAIIFTPLVYNMFILPISLKWVSNGTLVYANKADKFYDIL
jgi:hypothetical protein